MVHVSTDPHVVDVQILAAFTRGGAGGNLAGVVLDAEPLTHAERQRVAAEIALSETAFVVPRGQSVFEVAFYTPNQQVPDCGHATVATFGLLAQRGAIAGGARKRLANGEERAIALDGERVFMEQLRARVRPYVSARAVAPLLGLDPDDVVAQPVVADNGVRFVLIATTRPALARIVPDLAGIEAFTAEPDAIGLYVTAPGDGPYAATARMFAPRYGIPEEPATGMAAGLFGAVYAAGAPRADLRVEQGAFGPAPAPSELIVRVEPERVLVGGTAALVRTRRVELGRAG